MFPVDNQMSLGRPFGIPLSVDRMLLFFVGGFAVFGILSKQPMSALWPPLVFVSIYLHELAHAITALAAGARVEKITLHVFGGLTHIVGLSGWWRSVVVSAAGPLTNIALSLLLRALIALNLTTSVALLLFLETFAFANLFWGIFNLIPMYPLDGGHILLAVVSRKLSRAKAVGLSAMISLVSVGMAAVFAIVAYRSIFILVFLGFIGWINVQRWLGAKRAGASARDFLSVIRRAAGNGNRPAPRRRRPPRETDSLRDLAEDAVRMHKLLKRGIRVGLGGLSPEERRLIMFHRSVLEADLARSGFDSLTDEDRDLLALHHEMEDRAQQ